MKRFFKILSVFALVFSIGIFSSIAYGCMELPDEYRVAAGNVPSVDMPIFSANAETSGKSISESGEYELDVTAFGVFPVKTAKVTVTQRRYVNVGGNIFGIRLYTKGVLVVGCDDVQTKDGTVNPAQRAGIKKGDIIVKIDGSPVGRNNDVAGAVEKSGGAAVELTVQRGNAEKTLSLVPAKSASDGKYKAGIWVRDSSAGIGTMTFYDKKSGIFAGLGHAVCDVDTGEKLLISGGDAVNACVKGCYKGENGNPGELCGVFTSGEIGELYENSDKGIYGSYTDLPPSKELPVALRDEVKEGKAQIISTIDDGEPQYYDIEITKIYSKTEQQRNMVIKVTDEELLQKTGGIVQGMSGSPIVQNGMLVGAVTHVFINDPTQGYAIFAQTMLEKADELTAQTQKAAS